MSLQGFLLSELVAGARPRSPGEVVREVAGAPEASGGEGFSRISSAAEVRADRKRR